VVSATDPHGRILGSPDRSRYYFFQVAPQEFLGTSGSVAKNSDHLTTEASKEHLTSFPDKAASYYGSNSIECVSVEAFNSLDGQIRTSVDLTVYMPPCSLLPSKIYRCDY
jgi:hypothetical protein